MKAAIKHAIRKKAPLGKRSLPQRTYYALRAKRCELQIKIKRQAKMKATNEQAIRKSKRCLKAERSGA